MSLALALIARGWPYMLAAVAGAWLWSYPAYWNGHRHGVRDGREAVLTEQRVEAARRTKESENAEKALRDCIARDPSCIMRDDGQRRD